MKTKKITKDMSMNEILQSNPDAAEILFTSGMGCVGCPMAMMESLEDGCLAHGMTDKDIEKLIRKVNENGKGSRKKP